MTKPFSIAIHGGAGTILREQMSDELQQSILTDLEAAVKAGHQILKKAAKRWMLWLLRLRFLKTP